MNTYQSFIYIWDCWWLNRKMRVSIVHCNNSSICRHSQSVCLQRWKMWHFHIRSSRYKGNTWLKPDNTTRKSFPAAPSLALRADDTCIASRDLSGAAARGCDLSPGSGHPRIVWSPTGEVAVYTYYLEKRREGYRKYQMTWHMTRQTLVTSFIFWHFRTLPSEARWHQM